MSRACGVEVTPAMRDVLRDLYAGYRAERWHSSRTVVFTAIDPPASDPEIKIERESGHVRAATMYSLARRGLAVFRSVSAKRFYRDEKSITFRITAKGRKAVLELQDDDIPF
jgi:hypothetical protein